MSWHVNGVVISAYAEGDVDEATAASVEAHLISCAECRELAAAAVDPRRVQNVWSNVVDTMQQPRRRLVERVLIRLGVRSHVARLIGATPALSASWIAAVAVALGWSVAAAHVTERGILAFLVIAPLIPLAGVAFAYGPGVDPAYEIGLAAPMRSFRLLLLRSGAVLGAALAVVGLASLALPDVGWKAAAWLLPALAVSTASLALSTWIDPAWAGGIVGAGWVVSVLANAMAHRGVPILERVQAFDPMGQAVCAAVFALGAAVLAGRARAIEIGGGR